jgi:hypothetical protein
LIEKNKINLNIETYSISQTTLEQVFLSFASNQINTDTLESTSTNTDQSTNSNLPIFTSLDVIGSKPKRSKKTESNKFRIFKAKLNINV